MDRYDLLSPRKGKDDKTRWIKVGAMFPREKGGFSLVFDALPLPDTDGRVMVLASEPRDAGDRTRPAAAPTKARYDERNPPPRSTADDLDDEIPFN